jgi:colicin import membrane protein
MAQLPEQNWQAWFYTLALHGAFIALVWLASVWVFPQNQQASPGEPVAATLSISAADMARAKQAIRAAELASASQRQPKPEPRPQTSTEVLQETAQDWVDQPDQTVQEEINRNALQPSDATEEQRLKQKQGQVELTDDIKKDVAEENRQRLIKQQLADVKRQRALLQEEIEAQKLDALAAGTGAKATGKAPERASGGGGSATSATAKYLATINATARANWNTVQIPEQTRCQVEFTQIRGGEVIEIAFRACALDDQGRESIERALKKTPMPYAGFESVFQRKVSLTFCYPDEVCQ